MGETALAFHADVSGFYEGALDDLRALVASFGEEVSVADCFHFSGETGRIDTEPFLTNEGRVAQIAGTTGGYFIFKQTLEAF